MCAFGALLGASAQVDVKTHYRVNKDTGFLVAPVHDRLLGHSNKFPTGCSLYHHSNMKKE